MERMTQSPSLIIARARTNEPEPVTSQNLSPEPESRTRAILSLNLSLSLNQSHEPEPEPTPQPEPEPEPEPQCIEGETRPADDGCNDCVCGGGEWACTEMACLPTMMMMILRRQVLGG